MTTDARHLRGHAGEQTMGFLFGERGYFFVDGPSGSAGHGITMSGFDGVAYNPKTQHLVILDNKALAKTGNVAGATAIDPAKNLGKNLGRMAEHVRSLPDLPHKFVILDRIESCRRAVKQGSKWPVGVQLAVTSASGQSTGVSKALAKRGVTFINLNAIGEPVTPARARATLSLLAEEGERGLREGTKQLERRLARKAIQQTSANRAKNLIRTRLPRILARRVARLASTKAAQRTASLIPIVGWGVSAWDGAKGIEDIFRRQIGRGLAAIGCAVGDVLLDAAHAGDAVSLAGGTVVSLAGQTATIACQMNIEMARAAEKLEQLGGEIDRTGSLPSDSRLREYYELDEQAINELKMEMLLAK